MDEDKLVDWNAKLSKKSLTDDTTDIDYEWRQFIQRQTYYGKQGLFQDDLQSEVEQDDTDISTQLHETPQKSGLDMKYTSIIGVLVILLVLAIGISIKFYMDKKKQLFKSATKMLKGKPSEINKNVNIQKQVELLPYDKRWEFPRNRLKFGIQLGTGCFGRVVKAEAVGIKGATETVKTVAVKMAKSDNVAALEALIKELKILVYLGSHLNVVNLLGACTKNISKGDVLVIIEYCRYGNLQTYLIDHRSIFINQLDELGNMKKDDEMDNTSATTTNRITINTNQQIGTQELVTTQKENFLDVNVTIEDSGYIEFPVAKTSENLTNHEQCTNSFWQYQQDPEFVLTQSMTTRDLISWSFQIARGMDYLASKKIFHGDLAARNILLADNGVVKVADFGNSQQLYDGKYEMTTERKLPIKWMAIETLTDRILSSQSDVWSYGILLWEIFSLGKVPYPGIETDLQFIRRLQNGYRMDKPDFAPNEFGEIMNNCWKIDPNDRPTFNQLEDTIRKCLESAVCDYYVDLNFPFEKLNEEKANCSSKVRLADLGLAKLLDADAKITKSQTLPAKASSTLVTDQKTNPRKMRPMSFHTTTCVN